ncbi:hypothetical protein Tco_0393115 [Tanacetum coccineum]
MDNTDPPSPPDSLISLITEKICKLNSFLESLNLVPPHSNTQFVCTKENNEDVMFVELIKKYDDFSEEELEEDDHVVTGEELGVEYFDKFLTRSELTYHKNDGNLVDKESKASKIVSDEEELSDYEINDDRCEIGHDFRGQNSVGIGRDMHVFVGNMSHIMDFTILKNVEATIDPSLSQVVFGRSFVKITKLILDREQGLITFTNGIKEVTFKTSYRDSKMDDLTSEGHDLLSSKVILSEDEYRRGCERASDLESGFYKDIDNWSSYKNEIEI